MDKSFLIQLTNNLYYLTLLFPKKEPLRYKMRELADEILASFWAIMDVQHQGLNRFSSREKQDRFFLVLRDLEILDCFFEVAKAQNWVKPEAVFELQKEYSKIKENLEKRGNQFQAVPEVIILPPESLQRPRPFAEKAGVYKPAPAGEQVSYGAGKLEETRNFRQQKILEILKERGRAQVWEIKKIFPEKSKRTLRRDFEHLVKQGRIERIGEKNETFYKLKE